MAARQTNKRKPASKYKKSGKSKSAGKGVYLGAGLIALLLLLISVSIMSITGGKEGGGDKDKTVTVIPAEKPKAKDKEADIKRRKDMAETVQPPKQKPKEESREDITALIRLALYDHEVSRSSVAERSAKDKSGKKVTLFDITCDNATQKSVSSAITSILKKKGYQVQSSGGNITAKSKIDEYRITLKDIKPQETARQEPPKLRPDDKDKEQVKIDKPAKTPDTAEQTVKRPEPPKASKKPVKFAILLDDGGNSAELAKTFAAMKYPLAIAVLPHLEYSREAASISKKAGKTVFLHFPMAPKSYPNTDPGKGAITPTMPEILISGVVKDNFESLGVKADGFNNHMGSAITEDASKMAQVLKSAGEYTDTFIDSRTTAQSVAYAECKKQGYKCGINKLFIDNDNDINYIIEKIYEAAEKAKKEGPIIAIGHIRPNTLEALSIALPILEKRNMRIVPLKSVIN